MYLSRLREKLHRTLHKQYLAIFILKRFRAHKIGTCVKATKQCVVKKAPKKALLRINVSAIINNSHLNRIVLLVWKWKNRRPMCKNVLNRTISRTIKCAPFEKFFERKIRGTESNCWQPWRIKLIDLFFGTFIFLYFFSPS